MRGFLFAAGLRAMTETNVRSRTFEPFVRKPIAKTLDPSNYFFQVWLTVVPSLAKVSGNRKALNTLTFQSPSLLSVLTSKEWMLRHFLFFFYSCFVSGISLIWTHQNISNQNRVLVTRLVKPLWLVQSYSRQSALIYSYSFLSINYHLFIKCMRWVKWKLLFCTTSIELPFGILKGFWK